MVKKSYQFAFMTCVLVTMLINSALAASILGLNNPERLPGSYIVVLKDNAAQAQSVSSLASSISTSVGGHVTHTYKSVLNGFAIQLPDARANQLANHPAVKYVEADGMAHAIAASWGIDRIDQRNLPLDDNYSSSLSGSGVHAYIIDSGINANHNDFGNRVTLAYDAVGDGNGPSDCHGHGTHVAGTVGGATFGVATQVNLYAVRGLNCQGEAPWSVIIDAMDWVRINHTKPAVANMSIGGGTTTAVNDAANNLVNAGVFVATAAGNENQNACNSSPGSAAQVFNVGATTSNDARSSFSNWGNCVDILAPGSNIRSASYSSNNGTVTMSGTSMASPHVAGAGALVLQTNPNYTPSQVKSVLSNDATENVISGTNGSPNRLLYVGALGGSSSGGSSSGGSSSGGSSSGGSSSGGSSSGGSSGGNELQNGVPVSGLSATTGNDVVYSINVPSGASNLVIEIEGGSGDADLYTRAGAVPTDSTYACRPYINGNNETCTEPNPSATVWYARVKAYESFSGVTLTASYSGGGSSSGGSSSGGSSSGGSSSGGSSSGGSSSGGSSSGGDQLQNGVPITGLADSQGNEAFYSMNVPTGASNLSFGISGGSGDADLYVRFGAQPTTSSYDCRPYLNGNNETCNINNAQVGNYYVMLKAYNTYSGVSLVGSFDTDTVPAEEVIVDNADSNTSRSGTWLNSSGANPYNGSSLYCNSGCTFTWSPNLTESGSYQVYAWWTSHQNRSTSVPITVIHDGGSETSNVNQQINGGQWVSMGTYNFTAGSGSVTVSAENGQACADAVRFVKQ